MAKVFDFDTFQELSQRTLPEYHDWDDRVKAVSNYCMGLAGEAGELIDSLKKTFHHGHNLDIENVLEELGDILHYLSGIATMLDLKLYDAAYENVEKLKRRYPNGFNTEDSIARRDRA